jgi:2-dehydro-3-deoxyglucarate aldolase
MPVDFRARLKPDFPPLLGILVTLPAPEIAEIAAGAGFDWLWLDMEHGLLDVPDVQRAVMAAGEVPCLARVPVNEEAWIKRVLDTGVAGLVIPQVNTAELAARAVEFTRYPPEGRRSVGMARAQGYGMQFASYIARANQELALLVQIEHIQAVENLDAILAVPGLDGVILGPYDLSASMGLLGEVDAPQVRAAIARVRAACSAHKMPVGIYAGDAAAARRALTDGFQLVAAGMDVVVLARALGKLRAEIGAK